jgi:hypothetical protein
MMSSTRSCPRSPQRLAVGDRALAQSRAAAEYDRAPVRGEARGRVLQTLIGGLARARPRSEERMRAMSSGSVPASRKRMRPPRLRQTVTATAKTRPAGCPADAAGSGAGLRVVIVEAESELLAGGGDDKRRENARAEVWLANTRELHAAPRPGGVAARQTLAHRRPSRGCLIKVQEP